FGRRRRRGVRRRHGRRGGLVVGLLPRGSLLLVHADGLLQRCHLPLGLGRPALTGLELRFGLDDLGVGFFVVDVVLVDVGLVVGLRRGVVIAGRGLGGLGLLLPAPALGAHDGFEVRGATVLGDEVALVLLGLGRGLRASPSGQTPVELGQ